MPPRRPLVELALHVASSGTVEAQVLARPQQRAPQIGSILHGIPFYNGHDPSDNMFGIVVESSAIPGSFSKSELIVMWQGLEHPTRENHPDSAVWQRTTTVGRAALDCEEEPSAMDWTPVSAQAGGGQSLAAAEELVSRARIWRRSLAVGKRERQPSKQAVWTDLPRRSKAQRSMTPAVAPRSASELAGIVAGISVADGATPSDGTDATGAPTGASPGAPPLAVGAHEAFAVGMPVEAYNNDAGGTARPPGSLFRLCSAFAVSPITGGSVSHDTGLLAGAQCPFGALAGVGCWVPAKVMKHRRRDGGRTGGPSASPPTKARKNSDGGLSSESTESDFDSAREWQTWG